jgi:hypothetical protein
MSASQRIYIGCSINIKGLKFNMTNYTSKVNVDIDHDDLVHAFKKILYEDYHDIKSEIERLALTKDEHSHHMEDYTYYCNLLEAMKTVSSYYYGFDYLTD